MRNLNLQLKLARVAVGKTQLDVALEANSNQTRVSLFERGLAVPSPEEARMTAAALGSEPEKLFPKRQGDNGN